MKKIIVLLSLVAAIAGCGKENEYKNDFYSSAAFINASPGSPSMAVYGDTIIQVSTALAYRGSTGYLSFSPGTRNIEVRSATDLVTKFYTAPAEFASNSASTFVVYDTQTTASKTLKVVRLTDDLNTLPAPGTMKFRFLNLAIKQGPIDVTFVRNSSAGAAIDSLTIVNQTYIGATPNAAALSAFSGTLPLGFSYSIKFKTPGTQSVLASATLSLGNFTAAPFSLFYTFFAAGTAVGQPLAVGAFRNYP
jgi:hypothetical protein